MIPEFQSIGSPTEIKGRGFVIPVRNPGGYPDPGILAGREVLIDHALYRVEGVESYAVSLPYPDSFSLGLMVDGQSTTEMAVIVPTRNRPANAKRLADAHRELTAKKAHLIFTVDLDDPTLEEYKALRLGSLDIGPRMGMGPTLNEQARAYATVYPYVGFAGDDHVPRTQEWDRLVLEALKDIGPGAIVYGNDLLMGEQLPTAVFMDARIIQTLGYMHPPVLKHLYLDNFWRDTGMALGTLRYLPDVVIEHLHPAAGKADEDAGYREVWPLMESDGKAYEAYRRDGFDQDVEKLKRLG